MNAVWQNIWTGLTAGSAWDQANLVLGIAGVALMIRRNLWAFPVGLAAVTVQGILFYQTHFPADATLQVFYFVTLAWGWWHWKQGGGSGPELPVTTLSVRNRAITLLAAAIGTVIWALTFGPAMKAVMPWRDAFIAAFSVAAQVLQVRKNIENWPLWVMVNLVAVASYWSADLAYTAFLYIVYLVMAIVGWRAWHKGRKVVA